MNFSISEIINTIQQLILHPNDFWAEQKESTKTGKQLFSSYFLPLLIVLVFAVFIGEFFRRTDFFIEFPILKSLRTAVLFVLQYYISVFLTNELIKTFGGQKNKNLVKKLVIYSFTPMLLVSMVTGIFKVLYVVDVLGVYSFYLFWVGATELLEFPENKKNSFIIISIVVNFFTFSFLSVFLSKLLMAYY